jgi:hypothetical protein
MGRFVTVGPSSFVQPSPAAPPSDNAPDTERTPQVRIAPTVDTGDPKIRVQTHERFYQSLESMSAEDPRILCSYIAKYATSIHDPETAIALFSIVKKLKG